MSSIIINLILQAVAGALGGNAAAAGLDQADLGRAANTIAGAIGGVLLGKLLQRCCLHLRLLQAGLILKPLWLNWQQVA
jgi:uncharacterized membrane protein YeaQ/YmgE (transglycosylase-associated protein family)